MIRPVIHDWHTVPHQERVLTIQLGIAVAIWLVVTLALYFD